MIFKRKRNGSQRPIRVIAAPFAVLAMVLVSLSLSGCSRPNMDEFFMRGQFHLPKDVLLLARTSNPGKLTVQFGQDTFYKTDKLGAGEISIPRPSWGRQNLLVKCTFRFTDEQFTRYMQSEQVESGALWNKLPIPDLIYIKLMEIDRFKQADLKRFDLIKNGYYRCETTQGSGFAEGKYFYRYPPSEPSKDFLLAVIDCDRKLIHTVLKQDY